MRSGVGLVVFGLLLSACGVADETGSPPSADLTSSEVVVEVLSDSQLAHQLDEALVLAEVPFESSDGLSGGEGPATVFRVEESVIPGEQVVGLMSALNFDAPLVELTAEQGGGWIAGSQNYDEPGLVVSVRHGAEFRFHRAEPPGIDSSLLPCPTVPQDEGIGCVEGSEPPPSVVVETPDVADAQRSAVMVLETLGIATDNVAVISQVFDSSVEVYATFAPDGVVSDLSWYFLIDSAGDIIQANGLISEPVAVAEVRTVGADEATTRLWRELTPTPSPLELPAPAPGSGSTTPTPPTTGIIDDMSLPMPVITQPTPALTSITPSLMSVWDVSQTRWLIPAYRVDGTNGFVSTVAAVPSGMVRVLTNADLPPTSIPVTTMPVIATTTPAQSASVVPVPTSSIVDTSSATSDTVPAPPGPEVDPSAIPPFYEESLNRFLIGLPVSEAALRLDAAGWVVVIDNLDDPGATTTPSLEPKRATVYQRDGIVSFIAVG